MDWIIPLFAAAIFGGFGYVISELRVIRRQLESLGRHQEKMLDAIYDVPSQTNGLDHSKIDRE